MLHFIHVLEVNIYLELKPLGSFAVVQLVVSGFVQNRFNRCGSSSLPKTPLRTGDL